MKFVAFNGSPAAADSSTNVLVEAFLRGAQRAGAHTENIFLIGKHIAHCKGCFSCWFQTPGRCVMRDDMDALLEAYATADVVCFASPVYTWNITACLKNFVDRLIPLKSPMVTQEAGRFDLADTKPRHQQFVALSNCGFPGDHNFDVIKAVFSCCQPSLEIYRNCGKLLKTKDRAVKPIVEEYLSAVEQAGFELAAHGSVCAQTRTALDMPLMSVSDYVRYIGM